jgi:hypothetical protein
MAQLYRRTPCHVRRWLQRIRRPYILHLDMAAA